LIARRRSAAEAIDRATGWLMTLPALLVLAGLLLYPLVYAVWLGFAEWRLDGARWIGLDNYGRLFADRLFWRALGNTFFYAAWNLVAGTGLSLAVALLMNRPTAMARVLRVAVFLPEVLAVSVSALAWIWMMEPDYGLLNRLLLGLGIARGPVPWLTSPNMARGSIVMVNIWLGTGLSSILLLAALQGVPADVQEAAAIDGADAWQRFRHVVLPALRPVLLVVVMLKLIGSFKTFDQVFIMTGGGPLHRSDTILTFLYQQGFERFDFGYASAVGVVFLVIVSSLSAAQAMLMRARA
jgi:ABC-type sugar transport system permease subunit